MSYNLSKDLRITVNFPVKINKDVTLYKASFVKTTDYQAIALSFRKDDVETGNLYEQKYLIYDVDPKSIPSWTTYEAQLFSFKSRIYHLLENFYEPEDIKIEAEDFEELAAKVITLLEDGPIKNETKFDLKLIYNKSFEKIIVPQRGHVIKSDKMNYELSYTNWEKENVLLPEEDDDMSDNLITV